MNRITLTSATVVVAALLAACGSSTSDSSRPGQASPVKNTDAAFWGCQPASVAGRFGGFLNAVSERRQAAALKYIARSDDLLVVVLYRGGGPEAFGVDAKTPIKVFEVFAAAIADQPTAMLSVAVGDVAPFSDEYEDQAGAGPTAGAEIVARIGSDASLSGKIGIDCDEGRIYLGAMNMRQGLRPQMSCGKHVRLDSSEPILCKF